MYRVKLSARHDARTPCSEPSTDDPSNEPITDDPSSEPSMHRVKFSCGTVQVG
jgi:hypothetical protein